MALAHLCNTSIPSKSKYRCVALIVDHKLRPGSTKESLAVRDVLTKDLNIEAKILKLSWPSSHQRTSSIELMARKLRYQALGQACRDLGIDSLLTAHHADDVAETILYRLKMGYDGAGLHGISTGRPIPDCAGIHGVDLSGCPRQARPAWATQPLELEGGGIRLYRPLLFLRKTELIEICRTNHVTWFEDETNKDRTLTARNTIRSLLVANRLPHALQVSRLCAVGHNVNDRVKEDDAATRVAWNDSRVVLNVRFGQAEIQISRHVVEKLRAVTGDNAHRHEVRLAKLVKTLSLLVTPLSSISINGCTSVVEAAFSPELTGPLTKQFTAGKTMISIIHDAKTITLRASRQPPAKQERAAIRLKLASAAKDALEPVSWTKWQLFDGRYWIRLCYQSSMQHTASQLFVRLLSESDLVALRELEQDQHERFLDDLRETVPQQARYALPAIIVSKAGPHGESRDHLLALPSLSWDISYVRRWPGSSLDAKDGLVYYEIRYKRVELEHSDKHSIVG